MNPFDLIRVLAHIKAAEDGVKRLRADPLFIQLLADLKAVSDQLGIPAYIAAAIKAAQSPEGTPK